MQLFRWLSRRKSERPPVSPVEEFLGESEQLHQLPADPAAWREILEQVIKDTAETITAINRIERKQNRWIEILNLKEVVSAAEVLPDNGDKVPQTTDPSREEVCPRQSFPFLAGEPTEE